MRAADTPAVPAPAEALLALLRAGERDRAIDAGLMALDVTAASLVPADAAELALAQAQLGVAWAARRRHEGRLARLAGREADRVRQRTPGADPASTATTAAPESPVPMTVPRLPDAAAAALARAKARAQVPR